MTFEINLTITVESGEQEGYSGETSVHNVLTYQGKVEKDITLKFPHVLLAYESAGNFFYNMIGDLLGVTAESAKLNEGDKPQLN